MDLAMGPDREMAEAETDVSKGVQRELRRVGTWEGELGLIGKLALMATTLSPTLNMGQVYLCSLRS